MENLSLFSSAGMMECLGPLSKEDVGPCHYHYSVHSQKCKASVGGGPVHGPVVEELDQGIGVTGELLHHPMQGNFIQLLFKGQNFSEDVQMWGSTERKGGNTKLLFLFFSSFFLFLFTFCIFFFLCYVWGYRCSFTGALMDLLKFYLLPTLSF